MVGSASMESPDMGKTKSRKKRRRFGAGVKPAFLRGVRAVAAYMGGYSEATISRWMKTGKLPCTKIGRAVLVRKSDLDALMKAQTTPGGRDAQQEAKP